MEAQTAIPDTQTTYSAEAAADISEFLAFKLGGEEYGIDILRVQEIRSFERPTRMANAPAYILGVTNLRGVIVPIIDLRIKFGLPQVNYDLATITIVLNIGQLVVGVVVDSVSDVIALPPAAIKPPPEFSDALSTDHIIGMATVKDDGVERMMILMDVEKLMGRAGMGLLAGV